jgi:GNAT superfamily N-acetyltransferase
MQEYFLLIQFYMTSIDKDKLLCYDETNPNAVIFGGIMLRIIRSCRELQFGSLMKIYIEGNRENGADRYPHLSEGEQLLCAEQDFYQYLQECFFVTPGAVYAVWEENGEYVAALRLEPYMDGQLLAALETRPEMRKMGYASRLITAVQDWLSKQGSVKLYSHVSKRNTASLKTHQRCGFQRIKEYAVYADGSVLSNSCTLLWEA